MKKIIFAATIFCTVASANAQHVQGQNNAEKTQKNKTEQKKTTPAQSDMNSEKWSVELQFNPFSNNYTTFNMAGIKGRYFFSQNRALRINLGLDVDSKTKEDKSTHDMVQSDDRLVDNKTTTKTSCKAFNFGLGYEYHYLVEPRLDLYAGFEVGYKGTFYSGNSAVYKHEEYSGNSYKSKTIENQETKYFKNDGDGNTNRNAVFANVILGADYYITRNIYLGAELGLGIDYGKGKAGYYTEDFYREEHYTNNGNSSTKTTKSSYSSETGNRKSTVVENGKSTTTSTYDLVNTTTTSTVGFRFYAEPALRIGVRF